MPDKSGNKVIIHRKRRVFEDFFSIDEVEVSFEGTDGRMVGPLRRLSFERGDSVAALVLRRGPSPRILLVNQFKYPVYVHDDGWITETVAGMIDPGESNEDALKRELLEELGCRVVQFEPVATFYPSAGGSSERVFLFYCEVSQSDTVPERAGLASEGEDIRVVEYDVDDFFARLARGAFVDPKIIISGLWLKSRLSSTSGAASSVQA
jgi:ADP-ribose pyrophosphatase